MKYRKKPVIIDAELLTQENIKEVKEWVGDKCQEQYNNEYDFLSKSNPIGLSMPTPNGRVLAKIGDYVCKDIKGLFYPCIADVFEVTHEQVNG